MRKMIRNSGMAMKKQIKLIHMCLSLPEVVSDYNDFAAC